jgi:hypothetical protein
VESGKWQVRDQKKGKVVDLRCAKDCFEPVLFTTVAPIGTPL